MPGTMNALSLANCFLVAGSRDPASIQKEVGQRQSVLGTCRTRRTCRTWLLYEGLKEKGALMLIPSSAVESMGKRPGAYSELAP